MSLRKLAGLLAVAGLSIGLIGGGVGAVFQDQVTASENINVGTFSCGITTATTGATFGAIDALGYAHTVSYTAPTIESSAPGSAPFSFTVKNTGSIDAVLTISESPTLSAPWSYIPLAPASPVNLASGASQAFAAGVQWNELSNADLGTSGTVTWTVDCGEVQATQTITSGQLDYGPTGWAGWSCPTGTTIISASILDVPDAGNGLVASLTLWKSGASVIDSVAPFTVTNYPATPFGYTYAAGEEGAIAQNDNDGDALKIVLVCSL